METTGSWVLLKEVLGLRGFDENSKGVSRSKGVADRGVELQTIIRPSIVVDSATFGLNQCGDEGGSYNTRTPPTSGTDRLQSRLLNRIRFGSLSSHFSPRQFKQSSETSI